MNNNVNSFNASNSVNNNEYARRNDGYFFNNCFYPIPQQTQTRYSLAPSGSYRYPSPNDYPQSLKQTPYNPILNVNYYPYEQQTLSQHSRPNSTPKPYLPHRQGTFYPQSSPASINSVNASPYPTLNYSNPVPASLNSQMYTQTFVHESPNKEIDQRTAQIYQQTTNAHQFQIKKYVKQLQLEQNLAASALKVEPKVLENEKKEETILDSGIEKVLEEKVQNIKVERSIDDTIAFFDVPTREIRGNQREYISFVEHGIPFGKDLTVENDKQKLSYKHAQKRLEIFFKLCQFIENNSKFFESHEFPLTCMINQFKALKSYTSKQEVYPLDKYFVEAHISFYPNLACFETRNQIAFVKGGRIDLGGTAVNVDEMLNLTDRIPRGLNDIDAVCEAYLRLDGMRLFNAISRGKMTAVQASKAFAKKYLDCTYVLAMKAQIFIPDLNKEELEKNKKTLITHMNEALPDRDYFNNVGPKDSNYIKGIIEAIKNKNFI